MKKIFVKAITLTIISTNSLIAQSIGINSTGNVAHTSALLDLDASPNNNTGFLMPRMNTTQRLAITSPADGLLVYDISLGGVYRFSAINNKWDCLTTPAGTVNYFANAIAPIGYLTCDGSAVNRTQYPELFSAIGTLYGSGNGTTTFNLPDLRGEFIRGAALTGTVDAGRAIGSWQQATSVGDAVFGGWVGQQMAIHIFDQDVLIPITGRTIRNDYMYATSNNNTLTDNGLGYGRLVRPRNIALLPCIKY